MSQPLTNEKRVTVRALPTPFLPVAKKPVILSIDHEMTVGMACGKAFPGEGLNNFAVKAGDSPAIRSAAEDVPCDGAEIYAWMVPEAEAAAAIWAATVAFVKAYGGYIAASMAVMSMGYSVYSYVQAKKAMKGAKNSRYGKEVEDTSEQNYGWDFDAANIATEGAPVPVLYGERYVIPPILQKRSVVSPVSGKEFMEVLLGVCQGGGGFLDEVSFPPDKDGDLDILLNHASWKHYISNEQFSSDASQEVNRINTSVTIYNGVYWTGNTLDAYATAMTDNLKDGDTTTRATGLASSQKYDGRNSPSKSGKGGDKRTRNFYFVLPDPCQISSVRIFMNHAGPRFKVYAGDTSDITKYQLIGSFPGNGTPNSWKTCYCNTGGRFFRHVLITDFAKSNESRFYELEVYGSINTSVEEGITGYAEVDSRAGRYIQAPFAICGGVWATLNVSKGLNLDWFTFATSPGASPEMLVCNLEFPYGLYDMSSLTMSGKTVKIACERRGVAVDGSMSEWVKFNSSFDASSVIEITDATASSKKFQIATDENALGGFSYYEIRMKFYEDPGIGATVSAACNWTGVDEGYGHQPSYPRVAVAAVRMMATESLYGGLPQIKVRAARNTIMAYNPIDGEWQAKPASNPAWAAWDLLVRPTFDDSSFSVNDFYDEDTGEFLVDPADYLREEAFPHDRVRYSDFSAWADFCEQEGIIMSMYYDGTSSVMECLQYILEIGRACLVNRGNVLGVVVDREVEQTDKFGSPSPIFIFDETNIVADSWSVEYRDRSNFPTEIQVTYYDREREYSRKSVLVRQADNILNHNTKDVTLYCCDDNAVARRHAEYVLGQNLIRKCYAWTGDLDAMPLDVGDVVRVNGEMATITSVTFDDELRRQFRAVEYSHARYGWVARTISLTGDYQTFSMPHVPDGLTFADVFTVNGEFVLDTIARQTLYTPIPPQQAIQILLPSSPILPNVGYYIRRSSAYPAVGGVSWIDNMRHYPTSLSIGTTWKCIGLSFEIKDFVRQYSDIAGVNYAEKVSFHYGYWLPGESSPSWSPVKPDVNGKIHLLPYVSYMAAASEDLDLPMFRAF